MELTHGEGWYRSGIARSKAMYIFKAFITFCQIFLPEELFQFLFFPLMGHFVYPQIPGLKYNSNSQVMALGGGAFGDDWFIRAESS